MIGNMVGGVFWCIRPITDAQTAPMEPYKGMLVKLVSGIYALEILTPQCDSKRVRVSQYFKAGDKKHLYQDRESANEAFLKAQTVHIQSLESQLTIESKRLLDFTLKATNATIN